MYPPKYEDGNCLDCWNWKDIPASCKIQRFLSPYLWTYLFLMKCTYFPYSLSLTYLITFYFEILRFTYLKTSVFITFQIIYLKYICHDDLWLVRDVASDSVRVGWNQKGVRNAVICGDVGNQKSFWKVSDNIFLK